MASKKMKKEAHSTSSGQAKNGTSYEAKDIYVLEGLEPVRKRPGMYIGGTGPDGLHHLIWEVTDNSLDEAMAGYAKNIIVSLLPDNRVEVADDGRGIPVEKHPQTKKSALETVMTTLHAGGKFGGEAYKVSGGLHGVGVSVVCALSKWMKAEVCRDGSKYAQEYAQGKPKYAVKKIGSCSKTGTTVSFEPDSEIFKEPKFDIKKVINHLRQQAYLTQGVRIMVADKTSATDYGFYFEGGVKSYVKYLVKGQALTHPTVFYVNSEKDGIMVESAFQYTQEREAYEESFANNIHTGEGGTHLTGFRAALTRSFNDYAKKNNYIKGEEEGFTGDDVRDGLTSVVSVKIREPQFEGQTKAKLGNPEAKMAVEAVVLDGLADYLERNPQDARAIIEKCLLSAKARKAAKAARQTVLRKGILDGLALPGKLADCSSRKPEESELYIVEGESAGGCFSGDTKVALADGRSLSFKELTKENQEGKKNYCYTMGENGNIEINLIQSPRMTKENTEVIKIILDNNEEIVCTPDHNFMLRSGSYKKAGDLTPHDSLSPLYRKYSSKKSGQKIDGYEMVYQAQINKWVYAHLLSIRDLKGANFCVHHKDFNKLNNNPDNLVIMDKRKHLELHSRVVRETMARPEIQEKIRKIHQSKEYREKVKATMLKPAMKKMLSDRAKKQWNNEEYRQFMSKKFLEFYAGNEGYREKNKEILYENQKKYWADLDNRKKWSDKVRDYFKQHPEKKDELSFKAKSQWEDEKLLRWRSEKTKEQWTKEFRVKRKIAYNQTYKEKALQLLRRIFEKYGRVDKDEYQLQRLQLGDRSILRFDTICQRFFGGNEKELADTVANYNHKIQKIVKLEEKMDVYDLEVENTHNFALASGIFVHNSSRQARDRHFQAILPLRGKILNVEKARLDKMLDSKEIRALVIALGTAISDDFDLSKLRYHKIIIMTDADVDGSHIRTLLLTLFYRHFKQMVDLGHIYIAQPPLYKIQAGKRLEYAYSDDEKAETLKNIAKEIKTTPSIQRYKGLGEMNPGELWSTTMDPQNRVLLQVTVEDAKEADRIFDILMGDEVMPRKKFIQAHAKSVKNLDV